MTDPIDTILLRVPRHAWDDLEAAMLDPEGRMPAKVWEVYRCAKVVVEGTVAEGLREIIDLTTADAPAPRCPAPVTLPAPMSPSLPEPIEGGPLPPAFFKAPSPPEADADPLIERCRLCGCEWLCPNCGGIAAKCAYPWTACNSEKVHAKDCPHYVEPFEEWHARECPWVTSGNPVHPCSAMRDHPKWEPAVGPRFAGRTCREVYEAERAGRGK